MLRNWLAPIAAAMLLAGCASTTQSELADMLAWSFLFLASPDG